MTVRILICDVMEGLRQLQDESVHCVVTSPPYWGLRDYGTGAWDGGDPDCDHRPIAGRGGGDTDTKHPNGAPRAISPARGGDPLRCRCGARKVDRQIGLEPTPDAFVQKMVEVFREVRRVLRNDGTLWLNMGDSYAGSWGAQSRGDYTSGTLDHPSKRILSTRQIEAAQRHACGTGSTKRTPGLKPKDLMGMPWRVAFALQADGWWLRGDYIWHKPNPMPESVTDRCTKAHEYVFHLAKSERYYFDAEAIKETAFWPEGPNSPGSIKSPYGQGFTRANVGAKGNANTFRGGSYVNGKPGPRTVRGNSKPGKNETDHRGKAGFNARWDEAEAEGTAPVSRNKRSVWTIATALMPSASSSTRTTPPWPSAASPATAWNEGRAPWRTWPQRGCRRRHWRR